MSAPPPTGTLTFLLSDIGGTAQDWDAHRVSTVEAVVRHYEVLDAAVRAHGDFRPADQGDGTSVVAVFPLASDAVRAAVDIQVALADPSWPDGARLAVRTALHTGEATLRDGDDGTRQALARAERLRAVGHGGRFCVPDRPPRWRRTACPTG